MVKRISYLKIFEIVAAIPLICVSRRENEINPPIIKIVKTLKSDVYETNKITVNF
jgi:hypothetical protein